MRSVEHAEAAIKHLNGYNLHGRVIRVDFSATQKAHNPTPGQYMGEKKPLSECDGRSWPWTTAHETGHYDGAYRPPYDRRDRPDRYDDRDRYDPRGRADRYDRYDERRE
jgi:transformer-2 protein